MICNLRTMSLKNNSRNLINTLHARGYYIISTAKKENSSPHLVPKTNFHMKDSPFCTPISTIYPTTITQHLSTTKSMMEKSAVKLSKKDQLKNAVKDYGSTVIVFHVTISLASLGFFYLLVSSGIDMQQVMTYFGVNYKFAENAGTFVTAYAIHKLFAPVRISITLGATPFIVRYLRNKGFLHRKV